MTPRAALAQLLDEQRDRAIDFLQGFARIDTSNPPGDTRAGADHIKRFLDAEGVPYRVIAPQADKPNLLGSVTGAAPGKHLVLNGHIDVFPAGDRTRWSRDPWSGDIVDGDPLVDIRILENRARIPMVMQDGKAFRNEL